MVTLCIQVAACLFTKTGILRNVWACVSTRLSSELCIYYIQTEIYKNKQLSLLAVLVVVFIYQAVKFFIELFFYVFIYSTFLY